MLHKDKANSDINKGIGSNMHRRKKGESVVVKSTRRRNIQYIYNKVPRTDLKIIGRVPINVIQYQS